MDELGYTARDYTMAVFHQPNNKFPQRAGKVLGFRPEQIRTGLLVDKIGNTYAGSSLVGLTAVLDEAQPGDHILVVSFGPGPAATLSHCWSRRPLRRGGQGPADGEYIARRQEIDYATYARYPP